jgi:hypothetical protein
MNSLLLAVIIVGLLIETWILNRQLRVIHDLVNSTLTKAQADVAVAQQRIEVLESHIAADRAK